MDDSTRASAVELFSVARPGPGSSSPLRPSRTRYLERRGKVRFVYDLTDDTNRLRQECYLELFGGEALAGPFEPGPSAVDIELPLDQLGYYSTYDPNEGASTLGCWIVRDGRVSRKHAYLYEVTLPRPPRPEDSP